MFSEALIRCYRGGGFVSRRINILRRMQQLNVSQRQLAQYAMLSNKTIGLWLDNKITIPYNNILRIAILLDLEADDLVEVV